MLTGKRFVCKSAIVALETMDGKRVALMVPKGSSVQVLSGPSGNDEMVSVQWQDRALTIFATDLRENGIETKAAKS